MTLQVLTVDQVAALLQCSDKTVRARATELGGLKFGVDWVFPAEALQTRLVAMALQAAPQPPASTTPAAVLVQAPAGPRRRRRAPPLLPSLQLLPSAQPGG
jgi:hypothetical protein